MAVGLAVAAAAACKACIWQLHDATYGWRANRVFHGHVAVNSVFITFSGRLLLANICCYHCCLLNRPGAARHKRMSRQQRAAWVRQHLAALRCHLKQQLVKSELLVLPAGCAVAQESHVMLMQGSIQVRLPGGMLFSALLVSLRLPG
jgi:hypothetical protein